MVALDTNIAIEILRGQTRPLTDAGLQLADCTLPVTVAGELLFGARNSGRVEKNLLWYRDFIQTLPSLVLDGIAAEHYAEIRLALTHQGRLIPANDMWIAAICRANDVPLLTFDKHFGYVPGLQLLVP